jgi:5-methylcytosine-specific restriction endonuclease McrA
LTKVAGFHVKKVLREHKRVSHNTKKRRERRLLFIEELGGRCQICGEDRPPCLVFHHKLETQHLKTMVLNTQNMLLSMEKLRKEFELCMLVCGNCHKLIHAGWIDEQGNRLPAYGDANSLEQ